MRSTRGPRFRLPPETPGRLGGAAASHFSNRPSGRHFTAHIVSQKNFIANQWVAAATGDTIPVLNPSDGQQFETIARSGQEDVDRAVGAARAAFEGEWGRWRRPPAAVC